MFIPDFLFYIPSILSLVVLSYLQTIFYFVSPNRKFHSNHFRVILLILIYNLDKIIDGIEGPL